MKVRESAQRIWRQKKYYLPLGMLAVCTVGSAVCLFIHWMIQGAGAVPAMGGTTPGIEPAGAPLGDYADIIISVVTAVIVALLSITVTIFVFLKSALDRIIDENRYIANVANIYKSESANRLSWLCTAGFVTLVISIFSHWLVTFKTDHQTCVLIIAVSLLAIGLLINLYLSVQFWFECIRLEDSLQKIISQEHLRLYGELMKCPFMAQESGCLAMIGNWDQWETEGISSAVLEDYGRRLCGQMTAEQFINLFLRTEILLLSGERGYDKSAVSDSSILTVLQERDNILNPSTRVGNQDLEGRYYPGDQAEHLQVRAYMANFERAVGYDPERSGDQGRFFDDTLKLYMILEQYRDLLISQNYTLAKVPSGKKRRSGGGRHDPGTEDDLAVFAQGLYYFFLRTTTVFVSALHISNFSFNGFTLNFANFYSSILEDVSLYSSEFYHTIFARTQLIRTTMDVSRFDSIDFYNTKFIDSTLNNAELVKVHFEGAQLLQTGLSSCTFEDCEIEDSDFKECVLSDSTFTHCQLRSASFGRSKMRNIAWEAGTEIHSCTFTDADIQGWIWQGDDPRLEDCDFSRSTWRSLKICKGRLKDCDFSSAELIGAEFQETDLRAALFVRTALTSARFEQCQMEQVSLEGAALYKAELIKAKLPQSNLIQVSAVGADFQDCDLSDSDCSEADFSSGKFTDTKLCAARLYDSSFTGTSFTHCRCDYILADHLQFTFAKCDGVVFRNSSLSDSNLTESEFVNCDFRGSDLTGLNATRVRLVDCVLDQVDFSETRFVEACFQSDGVRSVMWGSNFADCKFESVRFEKVSFRDCIFTDALFIHCRVFDETGESHPLTAFDLDTPNSGNQTEGCTFV